LTPAKEHQMARAKPKAKEVPEGHPQWLAIEQQVRALPPEELGDFIAWFTEVLADIDWELWDKEIEEDSAAGRLGWLDALAEKARQEHAEGRTTPL
jgi:hypothetical protein